MAAIPSGWRPQCTVPPLLACAFASPLLAAADSPASTATSATSPALDPIVITGQRPDKPGTVTVLDADALTRQGATDMQNMARDVLRRARTGQAAAAIVA